MLNLLKHTKLFSPDFTSGIKPVFHITILFLLLVFLSGAQQNLVLNGGFEDYSICPQSNELNNGQFERVNGWWRPTESTPDYYNRCNNGIVSVPINFWGTQEAFEGDGYVGFGAISWTTIGENLGNEYFRTRLAEPLKPCAKYNFIMYVSLAETSSYGVGDLGAWFSIEDDHISTMFSIEQQPQVVYNGNPIIDTANWIKVEGTFIATGLERYLTIGYFRNNVTSDTLFVQDFGPNILSKEALYYVDNVSLTELDQISLDLCPFNDLPFPNIITPDGDNVNDKIDISKYLGLINEITIVNRWGNTITILNENNPIWDGSNCVDGIYYYLFTIDQIQEKRQTGFIQLIR